jgi:hypothetical protein
MTPHADIYAVWIFLAGLACATLLLIKRTNRVPVELTSEPPQADLQCELSARILKLERLIADSQRQLARTQELISQLDRAA